MGDTAVDKVLMPLGGRPVLHHSLRTAQASKLFSQVLVVVRDAAQEASLRSSWDRLESSPLDALPVTFVCGGAERADSVRAALQATHESIEQVFIHDGARPLLTVAMLEGLQAALRHHRAVALARPVNDTLRRVEAEPEGGPAGATAAVVTGASAVVDRRSLWAMETPQAGARALFLRAYAQDSIRPFTDDLSAVEALGEAVALVPSPTPNPKLTRPADLPVLEALLAAREHPADGS